MGQQRRITVCAGPEYWPASDMAPAFFRQGIASQFCRPSLFSVLIVSGKCSILWIHLWKTWNIITYLLIYFFYVLTFLLTYVLNSFTYLFAYLLTLLLTHSLTPYSTVLLEKLTSSQPVKIFPTFYGTRWFINAFTTARHLSLSWANSIQSIPPHPTSWRSILILSSHLLLGLPSGLFPSGYCTKTLYTPLFSPIHAKCPANPIFLDFFTRTILSEMYRSLSSKDH